MIDYLKEIFLFLFSPGAGAGLRPVSPVFSGWGSDWRQEDAGGDTTVGLRTLAQSHSLTVAQSHSRTTQATLQIPR